MSLWTYMNLYTIVCLCEFQDMTMFVCEIRNKVTNKKKQKQKCIIICFDKTRVFNDLFVSFYAFSQQYFSHIGG
jgi:hypothetical protein